MGGSQEMAIEQVMQFLHGVAIADHGDCLGAGWGTEAERLMGLFIPCETCGAGSEHPGHSWIGDHAYAPAKPLCRWEDCDEVATDFILAEIPVWFGPYRILGVSEVHAPVCDEHASLLRAAVEVRGGKVRPHFRGRGDGVADEKNLKRGADNA